MQYILPTNIRQCEHIRQSLDNSMYIDDMLLFGQFIINECVTWEISTKEIERYSTYFLPTNNTPDKKILIDRNEGSKQQK